MQNECYKCLMTNKLNKEVKRVVKIIIELIKKSDENRNIIYSDPSIYNSDIFIKYDIRKYVKKFEHLVQKYDSISSSSGRRSSLESSDYFPDIPIVQETWTNYSFSENQPTLSPIEQPSPYFFNVCT